MILIKYLSAFIFVKQFVFHQKLKKGETGIKKFLEIRGFRDMPFFFYREITLGET
jgi:hypothetical protein